MRSSIVVAALAGLAAASPMHQKLHKKAEVVVVDVVTDVVQVYQTVTAGVEPTPAPLSSTGPAVVTVVNTVVFTGAGEASNAAGVSMTHSHSHSKKPKTTSSAPVVVVVTATPTPSSSSSVAPVVSVDTAVHVAASSSSTAAAPVVSATAAAVAAVAAAPVASDLSYEQAALQYHNYHRANHSAPALVWEQELADYALITAKTCVMVHDMTEGTGGYGQNLAAYGTTGDIASLNTATAVADSISNQWVNGEMDNVPYGQNSPATSGVPEYLHFTQVVWVGSSSVGCATVQCGAGILPYHSLYTVCNYRSEGNVLGNFTENVIKPGNMPTLSVQVS